MKKKTFMSKIAQPTRISNVWISPPTHEKETVKPMLGTSKEKQ